MASKYYTDCSPQVMVISTSLCAAAVTPLKLDFVGVIEM